MGVYDHMIKIPNLRALVPLGGKKQNGHKEMPRPGPRAFLIDPDDGKKRVIVTVGTDNKFEPVRWFNVTGLVDGGAHEAAVIATQGALICVEEAWKVSNGNREGGCM